MADFFGTTQTVDHSTYVPLAAGPGVFEVVECKRGWHAATAKIPECPQMELTLRVTDHNGRTGTMREALPGHACMTWKHAALLTSCGLLDVNATEAAFGPLYDQIVGRGGRCEIVERPWVGRDGQRRTSVGLKYLEPHPLAPKPQDMPRVVPTSGGEFGEVPTVDFDPNAYIEKVWGE